MKGIKVLIETYQVKTNRQLANFIMPTIKPLKFGTSMQRQTWQSFKSESPATNSNTRTLILFKLKETTVMSSDSHQFVTIFKMGTALKGKNKLPELILSFNCSLWELILPFKSSPTEN